MLLNEALEGFSKFSANKVSKVRNIVFVIVFIFGFKNCNVVLLDARAANIGSNSLALTASIFTLSTSWELLSLTPYFVEKSLMFS